MRILVIGSGGREHALVWKLIQHDHFVFCAPGNAGTADIATNVRIPATDILQLITFAKSQDIHLTIVGPDDVLAAGCVDAFQAAGLRIFGPTQRAAMIESSKASAKMLMIEHRIPTAEYSAFTDYDQACAFVETLNEPCVVKASGLALGKGSIICKTVSEARIALYRIMKKGIFGDAGTEVVIERLLTGYEISGHEVCSGLARDSVSFPFLMDHKRALDDDKGDNCGGMGTVGPIRLTPEDGQDFQLIILRTLSALIRKGSPFTGLLFPGLMKTPDGIKVLEFNARFGDTEAQSYMRLLESDLLDLLDAAVDGRLMEETPCVKWRSGSTACVVMASGGYPDAYEKGFTITGIDAAEKVPGVVVFHAGTKRETSGLLVTNGGRVLGVSAYAETLQEAVDRAYEAVNLIHFQRMHFRKDIGKRALALEQTGKDLSNQVV